MIAAKIKATQGSEGARRATEIPWGGTPKEVNLHQGAAAAPPDPEVPAKAARRRFTAEYKLRVLTTSLLGCEGGKYAAVALTSPSVEI